MLKLLFWAVVAAAAYFYFRGRSALAGPHESPAPDTVDVEAEDVTDANPPRP